MSFDGPDGFDLDQAVDEESQEAMMQRNMSLQIARAAKNQPYLNKVLGMVREAAEKNII